MRFFLYNKSMSTNDLKQILTDEQLHMMSKENLEKVILLMQKQQSRLEDKVSDLQKKQQLLQEKQQLLQEKQQLLQKKQQLLEEKNKELEFINALLSDRLSIAQR